MPGQQRSAARRLPTILVAEMTTAEFFAERRARADFAGFDRLMHRRGGEPPGPDDTIGPVVASEPRR